MGTSWRTQPRAALKALPAVVAAAMLLLAACSSGGGGAASQRAGGPSGTVRLYTSVTQDTVDAVLDAFGAAFPDVQIELFRAPTGELDARIAAERREGAIRADVLWATDPLSVEQYDADGLLRAWTPPNADAVPAAFRGERFWGTRLLNVVMVANARAATPADWPDLLLPAYRDGVALSDPGFAGSALGTMAYFALADGYGFDYLQQLADNGATQVQSVGDVVAGVAEGQFTVGIALDKVIRDAVDDGSPISLVWPASGAIAIYSPIAVFDGAANPSAAEAFANFVLGPSAQAAIASTGWQPVRADVAWALSNDGQVTPDWSAALERRDELLDEYRSIFGG